MTVRFSEPTESGLPADSLLSSLRFSAPPLPSTPLPAPADGTTERVPAGASGWERPESGLVCVRCFRNPLTPGDLATRGKFGAELAPGSKIIPEKGAGSGYGVAARR
ncbi:hypothetical protein GCM10009642_29150 [Nocardiopsis metallicus]